MRTIKKRGKRKNFNKKAMVEVQFNWIFVLIAGALILAFFFSVIQKQRTISSQKVSMSLVNDFETITTSALQAKDTVQTIDLPNVGIDFVCTEECSCSFAFGDINRDYKDKIMYSPTHIEGDDIAVWTLDWGLPFRITNFLYLANREIIFFLVYKSGDADSEHLLDQIERKIPDDIQTKAVQTSEVAELTNENYAKAKFILLNVEESVNDIDLDEFEDADPSAVVIKIAGGKSLTFYERKNQRSNSFENIFESYYSNDEDMFGAIFADDYYNYECNMKKAFTKTGYVAKIYKARMEAFANDPELQAQGCAYPTADMDIIIEQANMLRNSMENLATISGAGARIAELNTQLLRKSCPTIY